MRLNLGFISSLLTRSRVWAKVATMAQSAVTRVMGNTVRTIRPRDCMVNSWRRSSTAIPLARSTWVKQKRMNPESRSPMRPASSQKVEKEPSSVTTATAS